MEMVRLQRSKNDLSSSSYGKQEFNIDTGQPATSMYLSSLEEKITVLVTHQWQYLKAASWILILKGGTIVQCGTYIGLLESGVDFDFLLKKNEQEPSPDLESSTLKNQSRPLMRGAAPELQDTENIEVTLPLEDHLEGKVGIKTYNDYFTAGAQWFILIFLILVNIAAQNWLMQLWDLAG
ncbi:PREDICTED: multidrug resistance-associated protein 4-like [Capra hircus]|uniref:multidrug resistance-associated protein 4-like n=1 Tax=Capra hircus TaxID=9925 RepID=UPI000847C36D|nr:PREDICTED: multidrug resistance-associated protein 4-like [Capra hircus]